VIEVGLGPHSLAGFGPPGRPLAQVLSEAAGAGYSHFMFLAWEGNPGADSQGDAPDAFLNLLASDRGALRGRLARHGLKASAVYPGFIPDYAPGNVRKTVERLADYREAAWELGCNLLILPAGAAEAPRTPLERKRDGVLRVAEVVSAVSSDTPGTECRVAVDAHYHALVETAEDCEFLLANMARRNAGICVSMGHLHTAGSRGWELILRHPGRVHAIAWKDHRAKDDPTGKHPFTAHELGTGDTPLREYVRAVLATQHAGPHYITLDDVPRERRADAMRRSREHLFALFTEESAVQGIGSAGSP
jgi:sugar phosphate isomerase/epimerase